MPTDNFDGADANPIGNPYTTITGCTAIKRISNKAQGTGADWNGCYRNDFTPNNDQYSKIAGAQTTFSKSYGPMVRIQVDPTNLTGYWLAREMATELYLYKVEDGTPTQLGAAYTSTYANGEVLGLKVATVGGNAVLTPSRNGSDLATRTDSSSPLTSGRVGFLTYGTALMDNWEGGNVAVAGSFMQGVMQHHFIPPFIGGN